MCIRDSLSPETLRDRLTDFQNREEKMSVREKQEENAYHMLLEMQMRGIRMLPVDLYKSDEMCIRDSHSIPPRARLYP